jgi:hypothetical protein
MVAPLALTLALVTQAAAAAPLPKVRPSDAGSTATFAAEQVARAAQQLRGDATIVAALAAVKVGTDAAEQALAAHGFVTALDLRLLAGGPEAAELMAALSTGGELSIADRAKVRLLVGDQTHFARVARTMSLPTEDVADREQGEQASFWGSHRRLQDGGSDRGGLSADTIAIVFSVCVGVCGYLLQAWTSDRANRHAAELQREHDEQARVLAVEQDRTQAQIRRTARWVDDCCMPVGRALGEYSIARYRFGECQRTILL